MAEHAWAVLFLAEPFGVARSLAEKVWTEQALLERGPWVHFLEACGVLFSERVVSRASSSNCLRRGDTNRRGDACRRRLPVRRKRRALSALPFVARFGPECHDEVVNAGRAAGGW